jgi:imidazoleglycerol-phosphate dehydratase
MGNVNRETRETRVRARIERGGGRATCDTGVAFLDHMLTTLSRTSGLDVEVRAHGDLRHHVIEDVAIALGEALAPLVREPIGRYGERTLPMDDALVHVALDAGGRAWYAGRLPSSLYDHWMRSFATHARITLHVRVLRGRDRHHVVEAAFKALGFALREALAPAGEIASTKGPVRLEADPC